MLKMMTYQEANSILYTKLIPDEYCICKKTAIDNGADLDAFFTTNSDQTFPNNRLVPVDGISNETQPSSCFLPIDDMTMVFAGYNGDPDKTWHSFNDGSYTGGNNDIGTAGWIYSIDRIIMDNGRVIINSNNSSTMEVGPSAGAEWLKVKVLSEPTNISVRGAEPASSDNHFSFRGGYLSYEVLQYRIKPNTGDYRSAKIIMKAVKNTSLWSALETAANDNNLQLADNVCSTFVITVRQRAAAGYDNGEGKKLAEISNLGSDPVTLSFNSTSGTELDLAVWGAGSSSSTGYWSSITGEEGIDNGTTIGTHDLRNAVSFSGSGNSKSISLNPHLFDALYGYHSASYEDLYVFASWTGCASSANGIPPQPITGTCNVTVNSSDTIITSGTGFEYESGNHNTFNVQINSASALNLNPSFANANQIKERGSCIIHIKYRIGGDVNGQSGIHDMIIKRVDVTNDYYSTYIKPLFYISDSTWAGNTNTNRNYTAKAGTIGGTGSVQLHSTVNSRNAGYQVSMCDSTGQSVSSDTSTYSLTVGSTTKTITNATTAKFDATKNSTLTIDFTNVVKGTGPETKYFKIEQIQSSTIPGISENMSPEYAIIGFTFN